MKKYVFLLAVLFLGVQAFAQEASAKKADGAVITFEKKTHDFGEIVQGDKVEHTYKFTNTGTEPLVITNVEVSCGCTTPKGWPRDPIMPGGKGEITVAFNSAGKMGKMTKTVTIVSNAVNTDASHITFTTNVLEKKQPAQ
jgi:hypothetical protein